MVNHMAQGRPDLAAQGVSPKYCAADTSLPIKTLPPASATTCEGRLQHLPLTNAVQTGRLVSSRKCARGGGAASPSVRASSRHASGRRAGARRLKDGRAGPSSESQQVALLGERPDVVFAVVAQGTPMWRDVGNRG